MHSKSLLLLVALAVTYFGDYCTLIGVTELCRQLYGVQAAVSIYIVYCLPPLILMIFSKIWAKHQKQPSLQMGLMSIFGAIFTAILIFSKAYALIVVALTALGFVKTAIRSLTGTYVKRSIPEQEGPKVIGRAVTIRFVVMIFGGTLGGYLGSTDAFNAVFAVDAVSFVLSGLLFLALWKMTPNSALVTQTDSPTIEGRISLAKVFSVKGLAWIIAGTLSIGGFMAIEYPLIVSELGISPKLMGIIYIGHIVGALVAGGLKITKGASQIRLSHIILFSLFQIASFGAIGLFPAFIWLISIQIGFAAFFMVSLESVTGIFILQHCSKENYPLANIRFNVLVGVTIFLGSLPSLYFSGAYSLQKINISIATLCILGASIFLFSKNKAQTEVRA